MCDFQVLVTGATGRLGRMLKLAWAEGRPNGLHPVWSARRGVPGALVEWDILSGPAPALAKGMIILHLAGALRGDQVALSTNTSMALRVCDAANAAGARHVFLASSAAVYGRSNNILAEDHPPFPISDYGRAKLAMEQTVLDWSQSVGASAPGVTCLRIGNVVGADALVGQILAGHLTVLDLVAGQNGGPLRSYIGPVALADILANLTGIAASGVALPQVLNIAAKQPVYMADLLDAANLPFRFHSSGGRVVAKVKLATDILAKLTQVPDQNPQAMIADWRSLVSAAA